MRLSVFSFLFCTLAPFAVYAQAPASSQVVEPVDLVCFSDKTQNEWVEVGVKYTDSHTLTVVRHNVKTKQAKPVVKNAVVLTYDMTNKFYTFNTARALGGQMIFQDPNGWPDRPAVKLYIYTVKLWEEPMMIHFGNLHVLHENREDNNLRCQQNGSITYDVGL